MVLLTATINGNESVKSRKRYRQPWSFQVPKIVFRQSHTLPPPPPPSLIRTFCVECVSNLPVYALRVRNTTTTIFFDFLPWTLLLLLVLFLRAGSCPFSPKAPGWSRDHRRMAKILVVKVSAGAFDSYNAQTITRISGMLGSNGSILITAITTHRRFWNKICLTAEITVGPERRWKRDMSHEKVRDSFLFDLLLFKEESQTNFKSWKALAQMIFSLNIHLKDRSLDCIVYGYAWKL